jgi:ketosteroid isomerase-like protein
MEDHRDVVAYRRTADAFRAKDRARLAELIAEDVVWHVPGSHSMAGEIRGRSALLDWLGKLMERAFYLSEHDVLGNDEHVCALSVMGSRRNGEDIHTRVVSVFHYRDGVQLERWFYPEDLGAWNRIFDP